MHYLIRTHTGRGQQEAFDAEYEAKQLSLGSSGNETVQLPGLPGQTKFSPDGDGGATLSTKGLKATVDGNATSKAKVAIGDEIKLPGYALTVIAAPQGFDFALEIESEGVSYAGGMDLSERLGSMRRTSWIGALLVLVLMLIIPSLVLFGPDTANQVRSLPLPDDGLWSSGPLLGAHDTAGLAENCQACHETPFTMVKDNACLDCHRNITEHVDIGIHGIEGFSDERCASCHREHNEPATLMRSDNGLCVDCHAEPERFDGKEHGMQAATAFTSEDHPHFRLDLQIPMGPGGAHGWEVKAVRQDTPGLQEQSGLKFNHDVHLDVDKVQEGDSGDALQCASCHALEDDGEHFAPITMDNDCRSCHELTFDMFEPDLELPHGDTRAAIVAMEAHFIREFTDPLLRKQRAGEKPRRIPGKRDDAATCEGTGLDCGRAEALKEAGFQFADTGCITCHEVTDSGAKDILDRWYVQPVRIADDWFTGNRFDHHAHLSLAGENSDGVCLSCHEAKGSELATDILIPDQNNCLTCHDDNLGDTTVDCVSCHVFHLPSGSPAIKSRHTDLMSHSPQAGTEGE